MATIVRGRTGQEGHTDSDADGGGRETILLVEHNDRVRSVVRRILDGLGYFVLETGSAEEALAVSRIVVPELLLTDIELPGMSGQDLVDRLRATHSGLRVLYTSGSPREPERRWEDGSRRISFLEKPFTPACLAATVRRVLDEGREWAEGGGPM